MLFPCFIWRIINRKCVMTKYISLPLGFSLASSPFFSGLPFVEVRYQTESEPRFFRPCQTNLSITNTYKEVGSLKIATKEEGINCWAENLSWICYAVTWKKAVKARERCALARARTNTTQWLQQIISLLLLKTCGRLRTQPHATYVFVTRKRAPNEDQTEKKH